MSGLKDFAKSILGKPSKKSDEAAPANVQSVLPKLLAMLKLQADSDPRATSATKAKLTLAEFALPKVVIGNDGTFAIDAAKSKDWAFAAGHLLGTMAGLSVKQDAMNSAIDEVCQEAKRVAEIIHTTVSSVETTKGIITPKKKSAPKPPVPGAPSEDVLAQKRKMVENLEAEALLTQDLAAKAALNMMAERLKKEIDLNLPDGGKTD